MHLLEIRKPIDCVRLRLLNNLLGSKIIIQLKIFGDFSPMFRVSLSKRDRISLSVRSGSYVSSRTEQSHCR